MTPTLGKTELADERPEIRSRILDIWSQFSRNRLAVAGACIILLFVLTALFAPVLAPYAPEEVDFRARRAGPSAQHLFGTDELGRDVLSRIIFGSRIAAMVGVISVAIGLGLGTVIGVVAGFFGRKVDQIIVGAIDLLLAIPDFFLAIAIVAALGPNIRNAIIAIGITSIPGYARLARSSVLSLKQAEFIEAARGIGAADPRIMLHHILPNTLSPLIVESTLRLPHAILAAAGLSFLGLGTQPPTPDWGAMINAGRLYLRTEPHMVLFPGLAILLVVLGLNLVGDGLYEALDPRRRGR